MDSSSFAEQRNVQDVGPETAAQGCRLCPQLRSYIRYSWFLLLLGVVANSMPHADTEKPQTSVNTHRNTMSYQSEQASGIFGLCCGIIIPELYTIRECFQYSDL